MSAVVVDDEDVIKISQLVHDNEWIIFTKYKTTATNIAKSAR